jgi:phosphopantothenoylcysteine decarboxylase/phosphopantothenate--cysteine ligase
VANARAKLARKRADLIVLNDVAGGRTFGEDRNTAVVLDPTGPVASLDAVSKDDLADAVLDLAVRRLAESRVPPPA